MARSDDDAATADAELLRSRLQSFRDKGDLPRCYTEHPVVTANPDEDVMFGGLFVDVVAYANTDGVVGFWLVCLPTGRRHLMVALRGRRLCGCGRRGWCTLFDVFLFLSWCLMALAKKVNPNAPS